MSYAFHDIKPILQPYLEDLLVNSKQCWDHLDHLRQIFMHCRYYNIRLNQHKCIFVVESGWLLGFIVANNGIQIDPLKFEAISNLPLPRTILQPQILKGKVDFL